MSGPLAKAHEHKSAAFLLPGKMEHMLGSSVVHLSYEGLNMGI